MKKLILVTVMLLALALNIGAAMRTPEYAEEEGIDSDTDSLVLDEVILGPGEELLEDGSISLGPGPVIITTGPDNSALYEKAAQYTGSESLSARLGDPTHYESSFASTDGTMTVTVDADVIVPEAEAAPLIRVTGARITQAQVDTLMDALVHTTLYDPNPPRTKAEIMALIQELEQELENASERELAMLVSYNVSLGRDVTWGESMQQWIDELYEEHKTAPDTVEPVPISGLLEKGDDGMDLFGEGEEYGSESFGVSIFDPEPRINKASYRRDEYAVNPWDYELIQNVDRLYRDVDIDTIPDVTCSAEEARELCDPIVEALDIEGMRFYSALKKYGGGTGRSDGQDRCCWVLQYTRNLGGLPITYTAATGEVMTDMPVYQDPWVYETMTFYVDDTGVVGLWWDAPYELGEHVTEDSALLPFDEVMAIFERMFVVMYENEDMNTTMAFDDAIDFSSARNEGRLLHVEVSEVRLGYDRIAEMDKDGVGLLVPVWDFFGVITDEDGEIISDNPESSLLTVNAVDGNIIDRGYGY